MFGLRHATHGAPVPGRPISHFDGWLQVHHIPKAAFWGFVIALAAAFTWMVIMSFGEVSGAHAAWTQNFGTQVADWVIIAAMGSLAILAIAFGWFGLQILTQLFAAVFALPLILAMATVFACARSTHKG